MIGQGFDGFRLVLNTILHEFGVLWDALISNWITAIFLVILFVDITLKVIYFINGDGD